MANSNDFFPPFATAAGANVLAPSTWAVDPARAVGFEAGLAPSVKLNTAWRQSGFVAAMIAQFTADFGPGNVQDNGNLPAFEAQFEAALNKYLGPFFVPIIPATTFYVSTSGNDATGDGSVGNPWATIQYAINTITRYNFGNQAVTIQLGASGTYAGIVSVNSVSGGNLIIQGNASAQAIYIISGSAPAGGGIFNIGGGSVQLIGLTISNQAGANNNINVGVGGNVVVQNVTFGGLNTTGFHVVVNPNSEFAIEAGCLFAQGAAGCFAISGGSIILAANTTTVGSPVWSTACCVVTNSGLFEFTLPGGFTFANTGATGPRYSATLNGIINTTGSGANFFPGSTVGSTATGGQYA